MTSECLEQQKINIFTVYGSYACVRHTTSVIDYISHRKNVDNINFVLRIKSVALQLRRARTYWSGCCEMAVQGALWLAKRLGLSLNLNFSFLNRISLLLIQVATQLSSRGWVDFVPDPILPEKFLGYSRESNPEPLLWQSDVLTTIPSRRSRTLYRIIKIIAYP